MKTNEETIKKFVTTLWPDVDDEIYQRIVSQRNGVYYIQCDGGDLPNLSTLTDTVRNSGLSVTDVKIDLVYGKLTIIIY